MTEPLKSTPETKKLRDHLNYLYREAPSMHEIHQTRLRVMLRILKKMYFIRNDYIPLKTATAPSGKSKWEEEQLFSYFMSSDWTEIESLKYLKLRHNHGFPDKKPLYP